MMTLLIKDFIVQKKSLACLMIYAVILSFAAKNQGNYSMMYVFLIIIVSFMYVITADGYDEKNNFEMILNSLPISRRYLVTAKYISGMLSMLMVFFILSIFIFLMRVFRGMQPLGMSLNNLMMAFVILGIMYSIYFPIYFKFGNCKLRIFNSFFMLFLFCMPALIQNGIVMNRRFVHLNSLMITSIATFILLIFSIYVSIRMYSKRDF